MSTPSAPSTSVLITGASGFFGGILKRRLLSEGFRCTNIDLVADPDRHPNLQSIQGDIRNQALLAELFENEQLRRRLSLRRTPRPRHHRRQRPLDLERRRHPQPRRGLQAPTASPNLSSPRPTASGPATSATTSGKTSHPTPSNSTAAPNSPPNTSSPSTRTTSHVITIRCPTIIDSGRLGLLAILFEFIQDGKKVWVVGSAPTATSSSTPRISPPPASRRSTTTSPTSSTSAPTTSSPSARSTKPSSAPPEPAPASPSSPKPPPSPP